MEQTIRDLDYEAGGKTNLADGISMARTHVFGVSSDRTHYKNVAIVITDGIPNVKEKETIPEADEAKKQGIRFICVGVTNKVDNTTLKHVSSSPQKLGQNYFLSPTWADLRFEFNDLMRSACSKVQELQGEFSLSYLD